MIQLLVDYGDFDFQAAIIEIILRLYVRKDLDGVGPKWFPDHPKIMKDIITLKDCNFEQVSLIGDWFFTEKNADFCNPRVHCAILES